MAEFPVRSSGTSEVPLGGTAVVTIQVKESGLAEEPTSVQVIWKDSGGSTISDETRTNSDISTTATDGGAITITDISGTGKFEATYAVPNDGTYSPTASGLSFSVQVIAVDEDGTADTGAITFKVVPADVTVSVDTTAIAAVVKRRAGLLEEKTIAVENATKLPETSGGDDVLDLGSGTIYDIDAAYKNGSAIAGGGTDYTWNQFQTNVVLAAQAVDNDHFHFILQRHLSNAAIDDYIDEATAKVMSRLRPHYSDASLASRPTVETIISTMATGKILTYLSKAVAMESPQYRSGVELVNGAREMLDMIGAGSQDVLDSTDEAITRAAGAVVGGKVGGEVKSRIDLINKAQKWQDIYRNFYPENDIELTPISPRA